MKPRVIPLATLLLFASASVLLRTHAQSGAADKVRPAVQQSAPASPSASLTLGKKVFVERCAKCHGEAGAEPLAGGPPLSERKLTDEQLTKNVRGRLKGSPEEEQRAVAAYIRSFQKKS